MEIMKLDLEAEDFLEYARECYNVDKISAAKYLFEKAKKLGINCEKDIKDCDKRILIYKAHSLEKYNAFELAIDLYKRVMKEYGGDFSEEIENCKKQLLTQPQDTDYKIVARSAYENNDYLAAQDMFEADIVKKRTVEKNTTQYIDDCKDRLAYNTAVDLYDSGVYIEANKCFKKLVKNNYNCVEAISMSDFMIYSIYFRNGVISKVNKDKKSAKKYFELARFYTKEVELVDKALSEL